MAYLDGERTPYEESVLTDEHGNPRRWENGKVMKQAKIDGWRRYFIMTFLYKTPVPTIIFFLASVIMAYAFSRRTWPLEAPLISLFVIYYLVAIFGNMNIGHRHILPVLPPLFIFVSKIPNHLRLKDRGAAILMSVIFAGFLVWYALGSIIIWPDYLAYFNEPSGGPDHALEHLSDSNIDWGQDLKQLKTYMENNGLDKIHLAYFGSADPACYGIEFEHIYSNIIPDRYRDSIFFKPPQGKTTTFLRKGDIVAISGFLLIDTWPVVHYDPRIGTGMPLLTENLREMEPIAKVGYSIYIYRMPYDIKARARQKPPPPNRPRGGRER